MQRSCLSIHDCKIICRNSRLSKTSVFSSRKSMKCCKVLVICVARQISVVIAAYRKAKAPQHPPPNSTAMNSLLDVTITTTIARGETWNFKKHLWTYIFYWYPSQFRCDSFGNRPVDVSNNRNRKNSFGTGRVRSGSTGNRPVKVNNYIRPLRQQPGSGNTEQHKSNRGSSTIITRAPPHQQQSQQHNFAAPRKGIFNHSNNSAMSSSTSSNKDTSNSEALQNNKVHNKENLSSKSESSDAKLNVASGASSSVASGSPATSTIAAGVTAGSGAAKK